jgi:hypothetical protein
VEVLCFKVLLAEAELLLLFPAVEALFFKGLSAREVVLLG